MLLENFKISANAVFPMLIIILCGVGLRKVKLLDGVDVVHINKLAFHFLLPVLIYHSMYGKRLSEVLDLKMIVYVFCYQILVYVFAFIIANHLTQNNRKRGAIVQSLARSNFVNVGVGIATNMYGPGGTRYFPTVLLASTAISNLVLTIILEYYRGGSAKIKETVIKIAKNPMVVAPILGIVSILLNVKFPTIVETALTNISNITTTLILLVLGASFNPKSLNEDKLFLPVTLVLRLIVGPALWIFIAVKLGFVTEGLLSLVIFFGAPIASAAYAMGQEMDSDTDLVANSLIFGSLFSCFTLFGWIFILKNMGYL